MGIILDQSKRYLVLRNSMISLKEVMPGEVPERLSGKERA